MSLMARILERSGTVPSHLGILKHNMLDHHNIGGSAGHLAVAPPQQKQGTTAKALCEEKDLDERRVSQNKMTSN